MQEGESAERKSAKIKTSGTETERERERERNMAIEGKIAKVLQMKSLLLD